MKLKHSKRKLSVRYAREQTATRQSQALWFFVILIFITLGALAHKTTTRTYDRTYEMSRAPAQISPAPIEKLLKQIQNTFR